MNTREHSERWRLFEVVALWELPPASTANPSAGNRSFSAQTEVRGILWGES